jgi:flagellar biosynthesis chaperone FliJ
MTKRSAVGRVVWLREIKEKAARRKLAQAHTDEQMAREHLDGVVEQFTERAQPADIVTPAELRALQLQGMQLQELVEAAEAMHSERLSRLHESRDAWRSAAADLDSAENLKERRLAEEAGRARSAAERALDELHVARQGRRR